MPSQVERASPRGTEGYSQLGNNSISTTALLICLSPGTVKGVSSAVALVVVQVVLVSVLPSHRGPDITLRVLPDAVSA